MEKKLQKLAKTMDYVERAKRQEEAPLIEEAYKQHLKEVELSKQHHACDLQQKNRLVRMLDTKIESPVEQKPNITEKKDI
ncbi:Eukaryotic translation initiation factor 3 subunit A [Asimina triloba]